MELAAYAEGIEWEKQLADYSLPEEQVLFSGLPKDAIAEAANDQTRYPIILLDNGKITTFFILQEKEEVQLYSDNPHALLLRSFSTNAKDQGKGYSKVALNLLSEYILVHFEEIDELVLGVNGVNQPAIQLYQSSGFHDTGKRIKTAYGQLLIFSRKIKD